MAVSYMTKDGYDKNEPGVCRQCGCADQGAAQRTGSL